MDCKTEGTRWAGHGGTAGILVGSPGVLPPSVGGALHLWPLPWWHHWPHWSQDAAHGHSCPSQRGIPPPAPAKGPRAPRIHLLGGGDEIDGLQAGQRLPALVDVFHNWGVGNRGCDGGTGLRGVVRNPTAAQGQPCQPLHAQSVPSRSPLPSWTLGQGLSPRCPSPMLPHRDCVWLPGRVWPVDSSACPRAAAALVYCPTPPRRGPWGVMLQWYPGWGKAPLPQTPPDAGSGASFSFPSL